MCGRFALYASEDEIKAHFSVKDGLLMRPRYNIAPSISIPIVQGPLPKIEFARWGFIPGWQKDVTASSAHINARIETASTKPTFRDAWQKGRCLIPASGYFEWRTFAGKKQPYYIHLKDQSLFAFAGLWSKHETCAILTMEAPTWMRALHERMPVIIRKDAYDVWLNARTLPDFNQLFLPVDENSLTIYPVTTRMGSPNLDGKECILPL